MRFPGLIMVLAVCGVILSRRPWVKILCMGYLAIIAIWNIVGIIRGELPLAALTLPVLLVLLGMYVYGVHKKFEKW